MADEKKSKGEPNHFSVILAAIVTGTVLLAVIFGLLDSTSTLRQKLEQCQDSRQEDNGMWRKKMWKLEEPKYSCACGKVYQIRDEGFVTLVKPEQVCLTELPIECHVGQTSHKCNNDEMALSTLVNMLFIMASKSLGSFTKG